MADVGDADRGQTPSQPNASVRQIKVEAHGIDVIGDAERKGRPRQLFWPWFGANVSILGMSYGSFTLGFKISFWQALAATDARQHLLCTVSPSTPHRRRHGTTRNRWKGVRPPLMSLDPVSPPATA